MEGIALYIWAAILIIAVLVEALTAHLVCIWFVMGALAALIASFFKASFILQIFIFLIVTILALYLTRPLVKKIVESKKEDTNSGRYVGKEGIVIAEICNVENRGQISVMGMQWSARSENGETISENELVEVIRIEGVKLIVKKK